MGFAHGETVTLVSGPTMDAYGDPVTGTPTRTAIPLCAVAPRYSTETTERGRQGVIVGYTIYPPSGAPAVLYTDSLEVRGELCAVEGAPAAWVSPFTGWAPGSEITVKRAVG